MKDKVTIAIDRELLKEIDWIANIQGRSRSNYIEITLRNKLVGYQIVKS